MTLTIELTPEEAAQLRALAEAKETDESGAVRSLLEEARPKTGAELLQRLYETNAFNPDYGDPNMDGVELARAIRERRFPPRGVTADQTEEYGLIA